MTPILFIHGYSSEGADNKPEDIYGTLPDDLRKAYGKDNVLSLNLCRWISLDDGIALDDVTFAMDRALRAKFPKLLRDGFHVIIHSTGALVVRNWIRRFSPQPSPIRNVIHLAGANFGSGLAHIGRGQLARWARYLKGTGRGIKVLDELELGAWPTLDLHRHFLQPGHDMFADYRIQEFCLIGSQINENMRRLPIRYVKEDSSDNTVRTSAGNLNYNYLVITPAPKAYSLSLNELKSLIGQRLENEIVDAGLYNIDTSGLSQQRVEVPFAILFETAHSGDEIGILSGSRTRTQVLPLVKRALDTPYGIDGYNDVSQSYKKTLTTTFDKASKLRAGAFDWNKQQQYEGHAQLVFRLRDQYGRQIENFDITLKSTPANTRKERLEAMIEDKHLNKRNKGTITFYLRTQRFDNAKKRWRELLEDAATVHFEITAHEDQSEDIAFVPLSVKLPPKQLCAAIQTFRTTVVDVTLLRLPSANVFAVKAL